MNIPELGVLTQVDVRLAWTHEALSFTPWLAKHLDALSAVIGIPLELEGQEVLVEPFKADILARNPQDGGLVLIENQLEGADHGHLGQIMTYLAGLEAQTIIWIALDFRAAHLSALKWLNEHTPENYSFFAVKVKAVRIGDSAIAPVFEVVERPNEWERRLHAAAQETQAISSLGQFRKEFWSAYVDRFPDELERGVASAASNRYRRLPQLEVEIALYLANNGVGLYIRAPRGVPSEAFEDRLAPVAEKLAVALGAPMGDPYYFVQHKAAITADRGCWPELAEWLHSTANTYETVLRETFEEQPS